jgi:AraC-like DNA-binding protein
VTYRERPTVVPGVVLWERTVTQGSERIRILPDGCVDLIWDGRTLIVAGPDGVARWHQGRPGAHFTGLRFSAGTGPAVLGVPADVVYGQSPGIDDLWSSRDARALTERVAAAPAAELERWALERSLILPVDPIGPTVLDLVDAGLPVNAIGDRLGISPRQLHRRCLPLFGYGPRRLGRVRRLVRTLDAAAACPSLAQLAAACGYVDQAHLSREVRALAGTTPAGLLRDLGLR